MKLSVAGNSDSANLGDCGSWTLRENSHTKIYDHMDQQFLPSMVLNNTPDTILHLYVSLILSLWRDQLRLRDGVNFKTSPRLTGEVS